MALVEVNSARGRASVVELEVDASLENVVVVFIEFLRWFGLWHIKQSAEFVGKRLEVRHFCAAGFFPPSDEGVDIGGVHSVVGGCQLCVSGTHGGRIANRTYGGSPYRGLTLVDDGPSSA